MRGDTAGCSDLDERGVAPLDAAGVADATERTPRQEGNSVLAAVVQLTLGRPEVRRELVLHHGETLIENAVREGNLRDVRVRNAREQDLALVEQLPDRADAVGVWHPRVWAVELIEADGRHAECLQ